MTMMIHPPLSILAIASEHHPELESFFFYLQSISHIQLSISAEIPEDLSPYDVILTDDTTGFGEECDHLSRFVSSGGGWLGLAQVTDRPFPEIFGVQTG